MLVSLKEIIEQGKDLDNFLWEIIKYIKDILVYKATGDVELYSKEEKETISKLSKEITKERLLDLICKLSELANTIKWSSQKVIILQSGLIKACIHETKMENKSSTDIKEGKKEEREKEKKIETVKMKTENISEITASKEEDKPLPKVDKSGILYWPKVLESLRAKGKVILYTNLIGTTARKVNDTEIEIEFENKITPFAKSVLEQEENKTEIVQMITKEEGKPVKIKYVEMTSSSKVTPKSEKGYGKNLDIPINIIDE